MERYEDMSRMREHLYGEVDMNKDGLISYAEFMAYSSSNDFDEDEAWDVSGQKIVKASDIHVPVRVHYFLLDR